MPDDEDDMPEFTENGNFAVEGGNLYRRELHAAVVRNHSPDLADVRELDPPSGARARYVRLKSDGKYFLDCLCTAEDLINDVYPSSVAGTGGIRSKAVATGEDFGASHEANIKLAKNIRKTYPGQADRFAAPGVGQAYVIVSAYKGSEYPYHAAAVIAADGNSRVTLEVFASGVDAASRSVDGDYHIYSAVSGSGQTFHDAWWKCPALKSGTGATPPITLVVEPK